LVVHWTQVSISNGFRDIQPQTSCAHWHNAKSSLRMRVSRDMYPQDRAIDWCQLPRLSPVAMATKFDNKGNNSACILYRKLPRSLRLSGVFLGSSYWIMSHKFTTDRCCHGTTF